MLEYLGDDAYAQLQWYLIRHPDAGDLIQGSGGLRKYAGPRAARESVAALA